MRARLVVVGVLTAALALAGCSGGVLGPAGPSADLRAPSPSGPPNGLEKESARTILDASIAAATKARSVRIAGSVVEKGERVTVDLVLVKGVGSRGSMTGPDGRVAIITVHGKAYLKGGRHFWRSTSGSRAVAELFAGRWVRAPGPITGEAASIFNANFTKLFHELGVGVKVTKGHQAYVDRHQAIGLVDRVDRDTLWVSLDGKPYPLRIAPRLKGKHAESLAFSDWDAAVTIEAPKGALRMSELR